MTTVDPGPGPEDLLRESVPRVLAAVIRRFGDFAAAEDAVQEAVLDAIVAWRQSGVPANAAGWLFRVACRRMADAASRDVSRRRREESAAAREADGAHASRELEADTMDADGDDTLILLFMCCHPALSPPSAIALTLRAVGGLTTSEIARAFMVQEATMAQRISRAKQTLAESCLPFTMPTPADRAERLQAVRHVLYLIFSEGYAGSVDESISRVEMAAEAIRLTRMLRRLMPDDAETAGLLALMLLTHARRGARTNSAGDTIPLDEQDRSLWDRAAIREGCELLDTTWKRGAIGPYQLQAAIAALHDGADSADATDWNQILALYSVLERITDNPMITLNRAVAVAMVHGPVAGLALLDRLEGDERIAGHHRLAGVRAHLLERAGDIVGAIDQFLAAASATASPAERRYLERRAARLRLR